jgi:DnaK suppressor protein
MEPSREAALRRVLEHRCRVLDDLVHSRLRILRDRNSADIGGPVTDISDDPAHEDIEFALTGMQAQMLARLHAALGRLGSSQYGVCERCRREIPVNRLRALPFATTCRACQQVAEDAAAVRQKKSSW